MRQNDALSTNVPNQLPGHALISQTNVDQISSLATSLGQDLQAVQTSLQPAQPGTPSAPITGTPVGTTNSTTDAVAGSGSATMAPASTASANVIQSSSSDAATLAASNQQTSISPHVLSATTAADLSYPRLTNGSGSSSYYANANAVQPTHGLAEAGSIILIIGVIIITAIVLGQRYYAVITNSTARFKRFNGKTGTQA